MSVKEPVEQTAIIKHPRFGCCDHGMVGLMFTVYLSESSAANQFVPYEEAVQILKKHFIEDIAVLDGAPCWVVCEGPYIRFKRLWERYSA